MTHCPVCPLSSLSIGEPVMGEKAADHISIA